MTRNPVVLQTKWFGSKKFGIPSLIWYSCWQFPQTSFPSLICVSINRLCNSFSIFSSPSSSSFVGGVGGRLGNPSYIRNISCQHSLSILSQILLKARQEVELVPTSDDVVIKASQSSLGRTLTMSAEFNSNSSCTSSASLGWSGKERFEDLQAFTAQVRKFRVRTLTMTGDWYWWRMRMYGQLPTGCDAEGS